MAETLCSWSTNTIQNLIYLRERKQLDIAKKSLLEKWEIFKAKRVEHKKTLQERRGIMVQQEVSVAQREAEVGSVFRHGLPCLSAEK